jgi:exonuclease-1
VITEDSDLLPFGVKRCFFKMDFKGDGTEVDIRQMEQALGSEMFHGFSGDKLLTVCILSGCDYLESIKGIGLKKAYKLFLE